MSQATAAHDRELIVFNIGEQEYCVDIMSVREIRGWTPTTPLPSAPAYVRGVVNLRGTVLPVFDLAARLGLGLSEPTPRHVIIVVWVGARLVGLLVDSVRDIATASEGMIQPPPEVGAPEVQELVEGLLAFDGRMLSLIRLDQVAPKMEAMLA